ncbi:MAG: hypothetical protein U9N85_07145 [Bacteroidota bacterium]|nr:hypothetical protein [Bacteroidota bacterium]
MKIYKNRGIHKIWLTGFFLFFIILTYLSSNNFFFWDTVQLGSRHAHFFYENNFSRLLLPDNIDSGHIPTFGMYLAFTWFLFGKTLFVSHFAILPFTLGIVYQLYILLHKFISDKYIFLALTLVVADPTFLSQTLLVGPDIPLMFFFLLALNSVFKNNRIILSVAVVGLFLLSMRGMMISIAILAFDIYTNIKYQKIKETFFLLLKRSMIYYPALIVFLFYNIYHYYIKSWIGYHEDSPWAGSFERVGLLGFLKNIIVFIWRMLDFGRIFLWIAALFITFKVFKSIKKDKKIRKLLFLFIIMSASLLISFLSYKNLSGHRYILPIYLIFAIIVSYLIFEKLNNTKFKYIIFSIVFVGLITGNLWVYPEKYSQGWDASLAHIHYYKLHEEMKNYIQSRGIKSEDVGSVFPNTTPDKFVYLNSEKRVYANKNLNKNKYIFYSNVFNDFSDADIEILQTDFIEIEVRESWGVFVKLYKKK